MSSGFQSTMRPTIGTLTGRVWEIADQITLDTGERAKRLQVMEAFAREGGNPNTASTQYSAWNKAYRRASSITRRSLTQESEIAAGRARQQFTLQISHDGRALIPSELLVAMKLREDRTVTAFLEDGALKLVSRLAGVRHAQDLIAAHRKKLGLTGSVVDELISDRRAEAALDK